MIILLLALAFLFTYLFQKIKTGSTLPPGPGGLPLIGNLHQFITATHLHTYLWQLSNKYGPLMHMKLGPVPVLVISSEKMAKLVLKTHDSIFCSRRKLLGCRKLSYNCLDIAFSPYNDYWREARKITTLHFFTPRKHLSFRPIRAEETARMVGKIEEEASRTQVVNMSEMAADFAIALICKIAFGERNGSERLRFIKEVAKEAQAVMAALYVSDYLPASGWVDKLRGVTSRLDSIAKSLDLIYEDLIHGQLASKKNEEEEDIVDVFIRRKQDKSFSGDFTWDNIKALIMNILLAGADTSAASIIWTMTALMKAPNVMKKVQAEIREIMGSKGKVDEDDLEKLTYLKAVIYETFRLLPSVPLLVPRETMEKCMLDNYEIQPKTMVLVNLWAIGRDPEYWENPDKFLPERFLNKNINVKGRDFGLIPFGSGRRICPGMAMGLANVELALANLLYLFDWELPPGMQEKDIDTDASPGITLHKKIELRLVPKKFTTPSVL